MPRVQWKVPPADHPDHLHDIGPHHFCIRCGYTAAQATEQQQLFNNAWGNTITEPVGPQRKPCLCDHGKTAHTTRNHRHQQCQRCDCEKYTALWLDRAAVIGGLLLIAAVYVWLFWKGTNG